MNARVWVPFVIVVPFFGISSAHADSPLATVPLPAVSVSTTTPQATIATVPVPIVAPVTTAPAADLTGSTIPSLITIIPKPTETQISASSVTTPVVDNSTNTQAKRPVIVVPTPGSSDTSTQDPVVPSVKLTPSPAQAVAPQALESNATNPAPTTATEVAVAAPVQELNSEAEPSTLWSLFGFSALGGLLGVIGFRTSLRFRRN
jgi:hypothetical protein